ncbi:MAG TPA: hypothetical protein VF790_00455 [Dissulfurispiraceae bacterium]
MEGPVPKPASFEKAFGYERERLLNLIESRVKRNELESARTYAGELFNRETEYELLRGAKRVIRFNRLLFKGISSLVCALVVFAAFAVLDIEPSRSLVAGALVIFFIISLIAVDALIVRRFEDAFEATIEKYETEKQSFVGRVCGEFMSCYHSR